MESTPTIHTENVALFSTPPINVGEEKISWVNTDYHLLVKEVIHLYN